MKHALQKFFSVQHQFRIDPLALNLADHILLWIGLVSVIVSLALRVVALFVDDRLTRGLILKFYRLGLCIGLLELLWYGLRFENVAFFGTHFIAYLILVIGAIWKIFILRYWWKVYPIERERQRKEAIKLKYL